MLKFTAPRMESVFRVDEFGLVITGQAWQEWRGRKELVLECRLAQRLGWCQGCGCQGRARGSRRRWLIHAPCGTRPVRLLVRLRQFTCDACGSYWSEQIPGVPPRK